MSILDTIVAAKKTEVAEKKRIISEAVLRDSVSRGMRRRPFTAALAKTTGKTPRIIAEIKRASPSRGDIRIDLNPFSLAKQYEQGGAAALSVLTDERFFKGGIDDLKTARTAVKLPVLRKDFIVSAYQLYETAVMGADAALLIVRILTENQLKDYLALCKNLGMDALVETHCENEIGIACRSGARLLGINNRNLGTFETDVAHSARLAEKLSHHQTAVAESGIASRKDIESLQAAGIHCFLIGEHLVRADDPSAKLREFISGGKAVSP